MKKIIFSVLALMSLVGVRAESDLKLWYRTPADEWVDGMPVGNGKLFAVALGDVFNETLQLNEESLWCGKDISRERDGGAESLAEVRQLLFDGKYKEGEQLAVKEMFGTMLEPGLNSYQTLGDMNLNFSYPEYNSKVTEYYRELDLERAVATVRYRVAGVTYTRELFSSAPDQLIYLRLTADKPASINFRLAYDRLHSKVEMVGEDRLKVSGTAQSVIDSTWVGGVDYLALVDADLSSGDITPSERGFTITGADEVLLKVAATTSYQTKDLEKYCTSRLKAAAKQEYAKILDRHIADYYSYFGRVDISLVDREQPRVKTNYFQGKADPRNLPTDQRIRGMGMGGIGDPNIFALYYQFGRYLLISSSRPGSLAVNLWGKWIKQYNPSFDGDYHTNINIPMNYWGAEVSNLSEMHTPYFDLIDSLRENGRISARNTYGCNGFVAHFATDLWYYTTLVGNPPHGMWTLTSPWACHQMWEHYLFTGDKRYLKEKIYPIMRETMEFYFDYLVEDPKTGYLVTGPATSPENRFIVDGKVSSSSMGPTADMQVMDTFISDYISACEELGVDADYLARAKDVHSRLRPYPIGSDGRLMEWEEEFIEHDPGHKHLSHLYGVCEGDVITPTKSPKLAAAMLKSLEFRERYGITVTDEYKAISAWCAAGYVRLYEAEKAYNVMKYIIGNCSQSNLMATSNFGQIREMYETDANLGSVMIIAEFFLQSYEGFINILPALPADLSAYGSIKGLRARGGFEIDMEWRAGKLTELKVKSLNGKRCQVRYNDQQLSFETKKGEEYIFNGLLSAI